MAKTSTDKPAAKVSAPPAEPPASVAHPAEGGSYVRESDGTLRRVVEPTVVPAFNPNPTE